MTVRRAPKWRVGAVLLTAIFAMTACSGSNGEEGGSGGSDTLNFAVRQGYVNLDPALDGAGPQTAGRSLAYATLIHMTPDGEYAPGLAESWRYVGEGNKVFELTLRKDAKFSDGSPVNADAVKAWFDYFTKAAGTNSGYMKIESTSVVDEWTVRLKLSQPCPIVPLFLSDQWNIASVVGPEGLANTKKLATTTDGAGPYMIDPGETVAGDHYTYVPNPHFYDQSQIKFKKVVMKVITDPNTMLQSIKSGELQVAYGDAATAASAKSAGLDLVVEKSGTAGLVLADRGGKVAEALKDVRVRQAMNYAIDRDAISKALAGDYGAPSSQWGTNDGWDDAYVDHYPYDPDKAKALLAEAGYPDGFTLKVISLSNAGNYGDPVARAAAKYLEAIGIKLDITAASTTTGEWAKGATSGEYPAYQLYGNLLPMWFFYQVFIAADSGFNPFHEEDPALHKLWEEGSTAAESDQYWQDISRKLTDDAYFVPVFTTDDTWYVDPKVGGVAHKGDALFPLATEWTIK